jgi:hypothetical protein
MSERDVPALTRALRGLCEDFAADAASVTYISPGGVLVTLNVAGAHGVAWLNDEDGNVILVGPGVLE